MENSDMSEMISKISSMMSNSSKDGDSAPSISPESISNMVQMLKSTNTSGDADNSDSPNDIDIETILKFKNIFDKMNSKDDKRSKLLLALKPYLKDSRKDKLDKYIQFLNISKVLDTFGSSAVGGDKN